MVSSQKFTIELTMVDLGQVYFDYMRLGLKPMHTNVLYIFLLYARFPSSYINVS